MKRLKRFLTTDCRQNRTSGHDFHDAASLTGALRAEFRLDFLLDLIEHIRCDAHSRLFDECANALVTEMVGVLGQYSKSLTQMVGKDHDRFRKMAQLVIS